MRTNFGYNDQVFTSNSNEKLEPQDMDQVSHINEKPENHQIKRIIVYQGKRIIPVNIEDIFVVFTDNNYRFIQTQDEQYSCTYTLENMEQMFGSFFFRVNRQYLISYEAIDQIFIEDASRFYVRLRKPFDIVMQISRRKTHQFIHWLENGS
jgi:DNA-binding LytR/AlgR family response regulator